MLNGCVTTMTHSLLVELPVDDMPAAEQNPRLTDTLRVRNEMRWPDEEPSLSTDACIDCRNCSLHGIDLSQAHHAVHHPPNVMHHHRACTAGQWRLLATALQR
jgi:Pyruvate/2-oxoacid:ferredoxin oxidoreductase delta subunit